MIRVASMATLIPMMMVVGPLLGWWLGTLVGGWLGHAKIGGLAGLILGVVAAAREVWGVMRRIIAEQKDRGEGR